MNTTAQKAAHSPLPFEILSPFDTSHWEPIRIGSAENKEHIISILGIGCNAERNSTAEFVEHACNNIERITQEREDAVKALVVHEDVLQGALDRLLCANDRARKSRKMEFQVDDVAEALDGVRALLAKLKGGEGV